MRTLTPEQFGRVERLFFEAAQVPPEQRDSWLDAACGGDADVRVEVAELLRQGSKPPSLPPLIDGVRGALASGGGPGGGTPDAAIDPRSFVGKRVGEYEVTAVLGQGGMGVVFRASDTRLGRQVAIKALPPALVSDPGRLARFHREAKLLASLSHPNIATVYELEQAAGTQFLVMELIDGRSLAHRLARGPLPIPDALRVCREVALGVEAAHEAGVVHRDLKPGNVMCAEDGRVKVLDFGLAREFRSRATSSASSPSQTQSLHAGDDDVGLGGLPHAAAAHRTRDGAVLGTPGYMSPEQVRGLLVDRRTDVFAIGCILYECLTGKLAFPGDTAADVIVGVIEREPDWSALPARTPASVHRLLRRCLAKDLAHRLRDVGDVRIELDDAIVAREWLTPGAAGRDARARHPVLRALPWLLAATACAAVAVLATLVARTPAASTSTDPRDAAAGMGPLRRFVLPLPGTPEQPEWPRIRLALSRDGGAMAVTAVDAASQRPQLYVRGRDEEGFRLVDGTAEAFAPSFSPDGEWVLFNQDGVLRKKRLAGGNPVTVVDIMGFWGPYEWGADGVLTLVPAWGVGLARVGASGGPLTYVTSLDPARNEVTHISPCLLPDNSAVLFAVWYGEEDINVEALNLRTGQRKPVIRRATSPRFARTPSGDYLLFERAGTIYAAPFDPAALALTGPEAPLADGVLFVNAWLHACYDVADDGTLVYVPGPVFDEQNQLTWVDLRAPDPAAAAAAAADKPQYARRPFGGDPEPFAEVNFSSDGKRFSCIFKSKQYHLHVYDAERRTFDRIIAEGDVTSASISPDGQRIAYSATRDGYYSLYVRELAGGRSEMVFQGRTNYQNQIRWSPDGTRVAFSMSPRVQDQRDVFVVDVAGLPSTDPKPGGAGRVPVPFCEGITEQRSPRFSPNGRWLAYSSNEMGRRDVFLRSYPDGLQKRQVTSGGGDWADWSPDGRTLYYKAEGKIMAVPISPETGEVGGRAAVVYDRRFGQIDWELHDYTVDPAAPPGAPRLIIIEPADVAAKPSQINVILNWPRLLGGR